MDGGTGGCSSDLYCPSFCQTDGELTGSGVLVIREVLTITGSLGEAVKDAFAAGGQPWTAAVPPAARLGSHFVCRGVFAPAAWTRGVVRTAPGHRLGTTTAARGQAS